MNKYFFLTILSFMLLSSCNLEVINPSLPPVTFAQRIQGDNGDIAYGGEGIQTADSGYLCVGRTYLDGGKATDLYLVKLDKEGVQEWAKHFGSGGDDDAFAVRQTPDGGYVVVGSTDGFYAYVVKTDANGNQQWSKSGTVGGTATGVVITKDGNIVVAGNILDASVSFTDIFLTKYSLSGTELWNRKFGAPFQSERAGRLAATPEGGVIIAGSLNISDNSDGYLLKADVNGNQTWATAYGVPGSFEAFRGVAVTADGYAVIGTVTVTGSIDDNMWLMKVNGTGVKQWDHQLGDSQYDTGEGVAVNAAGDILFAGTASMGMAPVIYLTRFTTTGAQDWIQTYDAGSASAGDYTSSLGITSDQGLLVCGSSNDGAGKSQIYFIKTKPDGQQ